MATICDHCGAEGAHSYSLGFGSVVDGQPDPDITVVATQDLCRACAGRASAAVRELAAQLGDDRDRRRAVAAAAETGRVAKIGGLKL